MKQQVSMPVAVGIIAVLVIVIGYFIYNKTAHPFAGQEFPKPPMSMGAGQGSTPMEPPGGKPGMGGMGAMQGGGSTPIAPPGAPGAAPGGMMAPTAPAGQ